MELRLHKMDAAGAGAPGRDLKEYVLVTEQGINNFVAERFATDVQAIDESNNLWCCWVLYRQHETGALTEIGSGGVGFARGSIRSYALKHIQFNAGGRAGMISGLDGLSGTTLKDQRNSHGAAPPELSKPIAWD